MDIPKLSILRNDIKQKALKKERDSINKIITKKKLNRKNWDQDKIKKYEDDLTELKKSNDIFIKEMTNLIAQKSTSYIFVSHKFALFINSILLHSTTICLFLLFFSGDRREYEQKSLEFLFIKHVFICNDSVKHI